MNMTLKTHRTNEFRPVSRWERVTCGYCSTGCVVEIGLNEHGKPISTKGVADAEVNKGKVCVKGQFCHEQMNAKGRGHKPLLRSELDITSEKIIKDLDEPFSSVSWDYALDTTAAGIKSIQGRYGRDSFAVISTGQLFTEEFYTLGKLVRGLIGTNSYDGNTTLCMSSAVSGYQRSFGSDGPPGCYEDFDHTSCLLAIGSNLPECHPVLYWRLKEAKDKRKFPVIVVDPRVTSFAQMADIHLPIKPGTDVALLNSLAHVVVSEKLADYEYIESHTTGYNDLAEHLKDFSPERTARICGIEPETIRKAARIYGQAVSAMTIWSMGINQSINGSNGVVAINNLNLITGNIGKPGGTSLSITGQCNAMGTREFSSCSGLPGYRSLDNKEDRDFIGKLWNVDPDFFPGKRGLVQTEIFPAIETGEIKGMWIIGTNPATSMPNSDKIKKLLGKLEFLVVQDAFDDAETVKHADVFLPATLWAEKTGTFTNSERGVSLTKAVCRPPSEARSDLWVFNNVAKRFDSKGKLTFPSDPEEVFDEIREVSKNRLCDYSGITYRHLTEKGATQWPFAIRGVSNKRLYADSNFRHPDGKAKLILVELDDNNEKPDNDFPLWLNSGRVVEQFHTRTRTGKIGNINKYSPCPYVEINPQAAQNIGVENMEYVKVVSHRSEAVAVAVITSRVSPDSVFMPMHFHDCANRLTLGLLDPHSGQPAFKQCSVRIEKVHQHEAAIINMEARSY